jgi:hypothetical protein
MTYQTKPSANIKSRSVVCVKYDWISEIFKECYSLPHLVMEKTTEVDKSIESAEVAIEV